MTKDRVWLGIPQAPTEPMTNLFRGQPPVNQSESRYLLIANAAPLGTHERGQKSLPSSFHDDVWFGYNRFC